MAFPAGRVLRLYCPVRCSATPHADSAPVHEVSLVGLVFCPSGSGWDVPMIQSALPAVSALELSNRARCAAAASDGAAWATTNPAGPAARAVGAREARLRAGRPRVKESGTA